MTEPLLFFHWEPTSWCACISCHSQDQARENI